MWSVMSRRSVSALKRLAHWAAQGASMNRRRGVSRLQPRLRVVERTVANDNRPAPDRAEDDRKVAVIAARCLGMLFAPEKRMKNWRLAWNRWRIVQFVAGEVFENEQATVEQTVVAIQVIGTWQRYWFKYHPKARVQEQACDAWLRTCDVLEEHWRRNDDGYPSHS
jgi:hypothetical protein